MMSISSNIKLTEDKLSDLKCTERILVDLVLVKFGSMSTNFIIYSLLLGDLTSGRE